MPKYVFNEGYFLLNKQSNKLVFLQIAQGNKEARYEQILIGNLNKLEIKNDYELMELLSKKMFYYSPVKISEELKNYNYIIKALKSGQQLEVLRKMDTHIRICVPSLISSDEKWVHEFDVPEPSRKEVYRGNFTAEQFMNKWLKPVFNDAMLKYDQEMAQKEVNPTYLTEQER